MTYLNLFGGDGSGGRHASYGHNTYKKLGELHLFDILENLAGLVLELWQSEQLGGHFR
jgi:hypothetical protein